MPPSRASGGRALVAAGLLVLATGLSSWAFAARSPDRAHDDVERVPLLRHGERPIVETGPWLLFDLDSERVRHGLSGSFRAPLIPQRKGGVRLGEDGVVLRLPRWRTDEVAMEWQSDFAGTLVARLGRRSVRQRAKPGTRMVARLSVQPSADLGALQVAFRGEQRARLLALRAGPRSPTWQALPECGVPDAMCLRRGSAARFVAEARAGSRLEARLVGAPSGAVRIEVTDRSGVVRRDHVVGADRKERTAVVPLADLAGEIVRIRVVAESGTVALRALDLARSRPSRARTPAERIGRAAPPARNVVVVLIDTLRADRLGAYSPNGRVATPATDWLAEGGVVFERAYAPAPWTKPSVASLFTGLDPWQHGVLTHEARVSDELRLLSERLHDEGFWTAAFIANGYISRRFGFDQGWDELHHEGDIGRHDGAELVNDVVAWLDSRSPASPSRFFLYVHTTDCHSPYVAPEEVVARYDSSPYRGPIDFHADPGILRAIEKGTLVLDARDRERLIALYDAGVDYHETQLARLFEALVARGLTDDTLVIVTADHGEELFEHGSVSHGGDRLWESLVHVPMIVRHPSIAAGRRIVAPVGLVDVVPTVLEAVGASPAEGLSGRSMLELVDGRRDTGVAFAGSDTRRMIVSDTLKLVFRDAGHGRRRPRLFDLAVDPRERDDLVASRPGATELLHQRLFERLDAVATPPTATIPTTIDAATEAQLRALGYAGGD